MLLTNHISSLPQQISVGNHKKATANCKFLIGLHIATISRGGSYAEGYPGTPEYPAFQAAGASEMRFSYGFELSSTLYYGIPYPV